MSKHNVKMRSTAAGASSNAIDNSHAGTDDDIDSVVAPASATTTRLGPSRSLSRPSSFRSSAEDLGARLKAATSKSLQKMGSIGNLRSKTASRGSPSTVPTSPGVHSPLVTNVVQDVPGQLTPLQPNEQFDEKTQKSIVRTLHRVAQSEDEAFVRTLHRVANSEDADFYANGSGDEFWFVELTFNNGHDISYPAIQAMLDSGASHNTLSEEWAKKLQLNVVDCQKVTARAANGSEMEVLGHVYCNVLWKTTSQDFYSMFRFLVLRGQVNPAHISKRSSERLGWLSRKPDLLAIQVSKIPEARDEDDRAHARAKEVRQRREEAQAKEKELKAEQLHQHLVTLQREQQLESGSQKGPSFKQRMSNIHEKVGP